jgi:hypothetical protein
MPKVKKRSGLLRYWPHLTGKLAELERQKLSDAQHGCCAICHKHESQFTNRLAVDHNHRTGVVRGLLCYYCNKRRVGRNSLQSAYEVWQYLLKYDPKGG